MQLHLCLPVAAAILWLLWPETAWAQDQAERGPPDTRMGVSTVLGTRAPASLDSGGDVATTRVFVQARAVQPLGPRRSIGIALGLGRSDYRFGDGAPALFGDVDELRLSLPVSFPVGRRGQAIVIPAVRSTVERGADLADGVTAGGFAVLAWQLREGLRIGPGLSAFSRLEGGPDIFPFLAIDWAVTDRVTFATGRVAGATRGPGLSLSYRLRDSLRLGIAGRIEGREFALDDRGPAPGGTGEDRSFPLVATVGWTPRAGVALDAFVGWQSGGEIALRDSAGRKIAKEDYDGSAVLGGQLALRF